LWDFNGESSIIEPHRNLPVNAACGICPANAHRRADFDQVVSCCDFAHYSTVYQEKYGLLGHARAAEADPLGRVLHQRTAPGVPAAEDQRGSEHRDGGCTGLVREILGGDVD